MILPNKKTAKVYINPYCFNYPAVLYNDNIISVAVCSSADSIWEKSNYNKTSVDLFAPGKNIKSTVPSSVDESGYYIDQVGIVLKSEYSLCPSKVYEPEYFSDMIERTYNSAYISPDTKEYFADDFQQIITLYLKEPSCDNVKKAMKEIKDKNLIDVDIVDIKGFGYIYPS